MSKHLLLLSFIFISSITFSQTLIIKDQTSGETIPFVSLSSENNKRYTTADASGKADLSVFKSTDKIYIRSLGYKTIQSSISDLLPIDEVFMEASNFDLDEVVLSATKWRQNRRDIPAKIASVTPRDIAFQNPQTAADLLATAGGVFVQKSQQGGGSPMIRGFATNRLLYSVDGVRMNTAIFRAGNIQNVINLDPFVMENTEVIFGPGSVIYGSDAIGGVMSFNTLTPEFSSDEKPLIQGKANFRYSSANKEKTGHADINVGFKNWSFLSSISHWDFDHLRQGSHGPNDYIKDYFVQRQDDKDVIIHQEDELLQIPTAYSQSNLMQKIRFRPNEKWDFNYGFHYSETSPYGRYDRHLRKRNGTAQYGQWDYGPQIWMMNNFHINYFDENSWFDDMSIRLAHQWFQESRINRTLNKTKQNRNDEEVHAYSANIDFIKALSSGHTLFYGLEYVFDDVSSKGKITDILSGVSSEGASRYPKSSWQSMAVYITDQYKWNEKTTLSGGIRYNHIFLDSEFDTTFYPFPFTEASLGHGSLTGSLGIVYRPESTWVFSTNLGTAFRAPNVDDIGKVFDSSPGEVVVPNPDLKPEYAYNADIGIAKVFGEIIKMDLTAYYTHLKNSMLRRDFRLNGKDSIMYQGEMSRVQAIQNAAQANIYGIQAGIDIRLPYGFKLLTDLNLQKGKEELENGKTSPVRHAAPFYGISRLNFNSSKLMMELNVIYTGERSFDNMPEGEKKKIELYALDKNGNVYAPAWYTLNFKSMYRLSSQLELSAGMENITDRRYRPFSSGISGPGRNFIMGMTAYF